MLKKKNGIYYMMISTIALLMLSTLSMPISVVAEENEDDVINERYQDALSLQPVAPAFSVESLLEWSAEDDPDAKLNQASVPLNEERVKGHHVHPLAHPEEGITSAATTIPDQELSSSVGRNTSDTYDF